MIDDAPTTFEDLYRRAADLYAAIRPLDDREAVLSIVKTLIDVRAAAQLETCDELERRFQAAGGNGRPS